MQTFKSFPFKIKISILVFNLFLYPTIINSNYKLTYRLRLADWSGHASSTVAAGQTTAT